MSLVFKSHGKLLITGEYFVLKGAQSLCIPTKFSQTLKIEKLKENILIWRSFDYKNKIWIEAKLNTLDLEILTTETAEILYLQKLLCNAKKINSDFLKSSHGYSVESNMNFNRFWGLGSSSSLINNISNWANISSFDLLWSVSKGSGYDIACSLSNGPIIYKLVNKKPVYNQVVFKPKFHENIFFVYLNKKQKTEDEVNYFNKIKSDKKISDTISSITQKIIECKKFESFKKLIFEHEKVLSIQLKKKMVKEIFFDDYEGEIKSLGAWGGDFIMAAGPKNSKKYFNEKGFKTVFSFNDMLKDY